VRSRSWALVGVSAVLVLTSCAGQRATPSSSQPVLGGLSRDAASWTYATSLAVVAPGDLPRVDLPACARRHLPSGWVGRENAHTGDPSWRPTTLWGTTRVPIYLDRQSTVCGSPVRVHLGGQGEAGVTVRVYRIGWYGGAGARLVWTSPTVTVRTDPGARRRGVEMPSPGWAAAVALPVDAAWTPGEYLVESWDAGGLAGVAPLVVRDEADSGGLLVVHSNLTWAAYSQYLGSSLYKGSDGATDTRALSVSIQRPVTGSGFAALLTGDVPLTQFVEQQGLTARHILDTDLDAWPSMAQAANAVVLPGHSEYWTRRMYDAALAARNAGVNLADLGANELYWHARLDRAADGTPLTLTVDRTLAQDPTATATPQNATVRWAQAPLNRDGAALIGQRYSALKAQGGLQVWSLPRWLAVGTHLRPGQVLSHLVVNEADGIRPGEHAAPPDLQTVLLGVLRHRGSPDVAASTTYYTSGSGAAVFSAGTTYWTCDLTGACPAASAPPAVAQVVRAMTADVLRGFATAGFGRRHPSSAQGPTSLAQALRVLRPSAVGTYGA